MILHVYGGLANRLRAILSRLERDLIVVWEPNEEIAYSTFEDVFEPIPGVTFIPWSDASDLKTCDPKWAPTDEWDRPSWLGKYELLKPLPVIQAAINRWATLRPFNAMHIRRTDGIALAKSEGAYTTDLEYQEFLRSVARRLPVYVAADNRETQIKAFQWCAQRDRMPFSGSSLGGVERDATCHRHSTLADAVVDAWVCSYAERFMPCGGSSFSQLIKYLRTCRADRSGA